ncbi:MAG: VWA domain-containing protein [Verrucomicrobiota bacterium]
MFDPSKFTIPKARPLPVFLLLDVSGSMNEVVDPENVRRTGQTYTNDGQAWELVEGGTSKIQILNEAVRRMIDSFAAEERMETEFLVSIITFGDRVAQHLAPGAASSVNWTDMKADGCTAMGAAFSLAKRIIEDKDVIPSRAYRPTVVLVSDGQPTDDWEHPLEALITIGRSAKCFFMAMGIGENSGTQVLERFISQTPVLAEVNGAPVRNTVFHATDADKIHEFFRKVTMSATIRSKSQTPNAVPTSAKSNPQEEGGYW